MAIGAIGREYDLTFKCGSTLKTSTSLYRCVAIVPNTSTAVDYTVEACMSVAASALDFTIAAFHAIGICQSENNSNSENCSVRVFGVSKAICAASVGVGTFVCAYYGASTTSRIGNIQVAGQSGDTCGAYGHTGTIHQVVLGRALESGSTGTVISIMLNPQLYDKKLLDE